MIINFVSSTSDSVSSTSLPVLLASLQKYFSCFWDPVRKFLLIFLHCLSHHDSQEPLSSILSLFVIALLFCQLCIFKQHFYQSHSAQPKKATSPPTPAESTSPEELLFHEWSEILRLPSQHLSLSHLLIFVSCHAFALLLWRMEDFHWMLCTWKYHCHLAGRNCLPCCGCYIILKWNHVYSEEYRLPTAKFSLLQWLLGQLNEATSLSFTTAFV